MRSVMPFWRRLIPRNAGRIWSSVAGIMQTYADLKKLKPSYASILEPFLEQSIQVITDACSFEGNILTISENDTFLSVIQAVETGIALLRYGQISQNETLISAGYALINSYLTESSSFDLAKGKGSSCKSK